MKKIILLAGLAVGFLNNAIAQGLIVNEISQGPSGQKEFIELLVVGSATQTTGTVDISNWIVDDNSGAFATASAATPGIATGHFRFADNDTTENMPIGSLIVIYNAADKNVNWDFVLLDDLGNDVAHIEDDGMVYYIPGNSSLLRACSGLPSSSSASYEYTVSTVPPSTANWSGQIGLANSGDAIQTRQPDGTFYHGFGFSTPTNTDTFVTFPSFTEESLLSFNAYKGSALGQVTYLNCGSWYFAANYSTNPATTSFATTAETPGAANNMENEELLASVAEVFFNYAELTTGLPCPEILPVSLLDFIGYIEQGNVHLTWSTAQERDNDFFLVQKSKDQKEWEEAGRVEGRGNSNETSNYKFIDKSPYPAESFYRLLQLDFDGNKNFSQVVFVINEIRNGQLAFPNPFENMLHIAAAFDNIIVKNIMGSIVYESNRPAASISLPTAAWLAGTYFVSIQKAGVITHLKILKL